MFMAVAIAIVSALNQTVGKHAVVTNFTLQITHLVVLNADVHALGAQAKILLKVIIVNSLDVSSFNWDGYEIFLILLFISSFRKSKCNENCSCTPNSFNCCFMCSGFVYNLSLQKVTHSKLLFWF